MSGIGAKIGEWYEEGYVVYQLVRLLDGHATSVQWEAETDTPDEHGVDLWVQNSAGRVACQCKHLKSGAWTWAKLRTPAKPAATGTSNTRAGKAVGIVVPGAVGASGIAQPGSILAYAAEQLDRDPAHNYRLVTCVPAKELADLITSALRQPDYDRWWVSDAARETSALSTAWSLNPNIDADHRRKLHDRLRRMAVEIVGTGQLRRDSEERLSRLLGPSVTVGSVFGTLSALARD